MRSAPTTITRRCAPDGDELRPGGERVEKARARGREVEAPGASEPDLILDEAGRGGEEHVRGDRRDDQRVHVVRTEPRAAISRRTASAPIVDVGLARRPDPALADAGAGDDPVVGGVERAGQLGVGDDALGNVGRDRR